MMKKVYFILLIIDSLSINCCTRTSDFENAKQSISVSDLETWVKELGSDRFMGRAAFTEGEKITVEYLSDQLKKIGFEPAFSGSYFQEVPMVKIISEVCGPVNIHTSSSFSDFHAPDDFAVISPAIEKIISIDSSEMIFAGFGIVAPEYGWNDYSGLDVKGKTLVVLVNDPGLYSGDTSLFKGPEMTYYGRWTYKYEEAARQGALGILIIHESKGAGYDYTIPRKSSVTPNLYIQSEDSNTSRCRFTGWISAETAEKIFGTKGTGVSGLRSKACKKGFSGFSTGMNISLKINNTIVYNKSKNVAGILKGTERPEENIVYTAHWDHFGIGEKENGDSIYNGAVDNGTSMAWELAIGKAFSRLKQRPERSIILLFPTSEEDGLAGSLYYTDHPVFPIEKCVACLNNDLLLPLGKMKDVMITGYGQSELDDFVREAATEQDRYVTGDPNSHTGMYFRSDHFSFAKKGVPSLFARGNTDSREFGKEWAAEMEKEYIRNRYHKPSDNYQPEKWNFDGIAEDAALGFSIGYKIATSELFPQWKQASEFKKIRQKSRSN
jgi:Zn-dependent M28 family amino/carboxypeptidase